jgi:DNA-binding NarL/FixJ family response regulator
VQATMKKPIVGQPHGLATLTARQREVLQLVAEGLTTKQAAARLHLSPKTIETHRQQLMARLNLSSVADLTRFAVREGVVTLE